MFKDLQKASPIDANNFGAGSVMTFQHNYLVIGLHDKAVQLFDLTSMRLIGDIVDIGDANFLTFDEVKRLCNQLECTTSDFDYDSVGVKKFNTKWNSEKTQIMD